MKARPPALYGTIPKQCTIRRRAGGDVDHAGRVGRELRAVSGSADGRVRPEVDEREGGAELVWAIAAGVGRAEAELAKTV